MTDCEHFRTICCVKIAATLTLAITKYLVDKKCDKNVTTGGILSVLKILFELKIFHVMLLLMKIDEACINK